MKEISRNDFLIKVWAITKKDCQDIDDLCDHDQAQRDTIERLSKALLSLRNNVAGALSIEEHELRSLLGNTNVNCIQRNIEEADAALGAGGDEGVH